MSQRAQVFTELPLDSVECLVELDVLLYVLFSRKVLLTTLGSNLSYEAIRFIGSAIMRLDRSSTAMKKKGSRTERVCYYERE